MPEASAGQLVVAHAPVASDCSVRQPSLAPIGTARGDAEVTSGETRLSRFQLPAPLSVGSSMPAQERAWHKQRRHFWGSVNSAPPPFGVDGGTAKLLSSSARCSSYSVSAQSSALPGASPVSDAAPAVLSRALIDLPTAPVAAPASDGSKTPAAEPPRRRSSVQGAAAVSVAMRPSGSGRLLEDALRAACELGGEGPTDSMASVERAAAAASVTGSQAAADGTVGGLREHVRTTDAGVVAAEPTAGVPSMTAGQAAARSQRSHALWPMDNMQSILKGQGQPAGGPLGRAPVHELSTSWQPMQGPNSLMLDGTGVGVGANLLLRKHRRKAPLPAPDAAGTLSPTSDRLHSPVRLRGRGTPRPDGVDEQRPQRRLHIAPRVSLPTSLGLFGACEPEAGDLPSSRRARYPAHAPPSQILGPALTAAALAELPPARRLRAAGMPPASQLVRLPYSEAEGSEHLASFAHRRGRAPGAAGPDYRFSSVVFGDDSIATGPDH